MSEQSAREQLENEVARLRDLAIKSIDPLIVAKAVAASDPSVQQLILNRLVGGERLVEVIAFSGTSLIEVQVFFRLVPHAEIVHLVDSGILVFVDTTRGEMVGTIDPYHLQPEQRVARPFVSVSSPETFTVKEDARRERVERESSFFRTLGINLAERAETVVDTIFGCETWSGVPREPDDSRSDRTQDYRDEVIIV